MSPLRLRLHYGEDLSNHGNKKSDGLKFIYTIEHPQKKTIAELIQDLEGYVRRQISSTNVRLVQLTTADEYTLCKTDFCSNVLKDDDHLLCVDMRQYARENYHIIDFSKVWLEIKKHDGSDDEEKSIQIGLNCLRKLYIRLRASVRHFGICAFDIYELIAIAKQQPRDDLIARLDNDDDDDKETNGPWHLECRWGYTSGSDAELSIICSFKLGFEDVVVSKKLQLLLDHSSMRIKLGEVTHLSGQDGDQTTLTDAQLRRLKELASSIPPPKMTGPQLDTTVAEKLRLTSHECEGESLVRMACGNTNVVNTFQQQPIMDTKLSQHVTITHIIFSKKSTVLPEILNQKRGHQTEKAISVASLALLYQTSDGAWRECHDVAIAPIPIRHEEPRWLTDSVINIQPDKLVSYIIRGFIALKGIAGSNNQTRARVHRSLPQPLKLKILVTDNSGKQCSLIVEQLNEPLDLINRERFVSDNQSHIKEFLSFAYADNCDAEERVFMAAYITQKDELCVTGDATYSAYIDRKTMNALQFRAKQSKTSEFELLEVRHQGAGSEITAYTLFDPETYMLYAVRLKLTTPTSNTEETVLVPIEKIGIVE